MPNYISRKELLYRYDNIHRNAQRSMGYPSAFNLSRLLEIAPEAFTCSSYISSAHGLNCSRWPKSPKIDKPTWAFFGLSDMRHDILKESDMSIS